MNLPNWLTIFRIAICIPFVICLSAGWQTAALILFMLAGVTDFFDGYIARRWRLITDLGKFMDPIADKILTACALIVFVELGWASAWVVAIIMAREFFVSGVRFSAASKGRVVPADFPGKIKTAFTMLTIIAILICRMANADFAGLAGDVLLYLCAALTVWSGVLVFVKNRDLFKTK
jgi:CDP-diacylglycerol--glycerol-3-phosphate 3-phosphatidyltransferase